MPPLCDCHQEPMTRRNDSRRGWRCAVAHRDANRRHYEANRYALQDKAREYQRDRADERDQKLIAGLETQLAALYASIRPEVPTDA